MTFGGIGQGIETQHDVWRQIDYRALDGIRIREADLSGGKARIVADLAAAYPPAAGVAEFTRTFTWNGASAITIEDAVTLKAPRAAEWFLQSDTPITGNGTRFRNGRAGEPGLQVSFESPKDVTVTSGPAIVKAPGAPGSIEHGAEEERGHVLKATTAPASSIRFDVKLEILGGVKR